MQCYNRAQPIRRTHEVSLRNLRNPPLARDVQVPGAGRRTDRRRSVDAETRRRIRGRYAHGALLFLLEHRRHGRIRAPLLRAAPADSGAVFGEIGHGGLKLKICRRSCKGNLKLWWSCRERLGTEFFHFSGSLSLKSAVIVGAHLIG